MKIFKCEVCGNVIEKIIDKGVPVMCCGKPMVELTANTTDGAMEKHVPVAEIKEGKLEDLIQNLMNKPLDEIKELYNTRVIEK